MKRNPVGWAGGRRGSEGADPEAQGHGGDKQRRPAGFPVDKPGEDRPEIRQEGGGARKQEGGSVVVLFA